MWLFPMLVEEGNYFSDNSDFIELVSCPVEEMSCIEHLDFINKRMKLSRNHWIDKEFPQAIEELKIAFYKTVEINSPTCLPCAELFRSIIIKSLEAIHKDLQLMTTGFIKRKHLISDFELAANVLDELKKGKSNSQTI